MEKRLTTEQFIERAKKVHGSKYDYSLVKYINDRTKVCIICPIHGEFWQKPNNHLNGNGCKKCGILSRVLKRSKGKDEFIKEATIKHNGKYDYSKVVYENNSTKVCIICPIHGEFWQTPAAHLSGKSCPKCAHRWYRYTTEEFINCAKNVHGDKYDYSKVDYKNNKTKICIICPIHGEFWQLPSAHLKGQGCPKCANISNGKRKLMGFDKFIEKSKEIHKDKYDYSKVEYINNRTKVCIVCPIHGEFWQKPTKHLQGQGCPICNQYKLEKNIKHFLDENKIEYKYQYRAEWLKNNNNNKLSVDFYLPKYNIAIECQGIQHFKPVEYFGGNYRFKQQIKNDYLKKNICKKHDINVLYIIENEIKTNIKIYNNHNTILVKNITIDKIKNANK